MTLGISGKTALLVEDNELIAMTIEDVLLNEGALAVVHHSDVSSALKAISRTQFDFAILDVELKGEQSWSVAAELRSIGVPYLFMTGYGDSVHHELMQHRLCKPCSMTELIHAVTALTAASPHAEQAPDTLPGQHKFT